MKIAFLLPVIFSTLAGLAVAGNVSSEDRPQFKLGFRALAELVPELVGEPVENERHNVLNGDALQQTTRGLMVWRKADNWTAFTDGSTTWINGPGGLQARANEERFGWETPPPAAAAPSWERTAAPKSGAIVQPPVSTWASPPGSPAGAQESIQRLNDSLRMQETLRQQQESVRRAEESARRLNETLRMQEQLRQQQESVRRAEESARRLNDTLRMQETLRQQQEATRRAEESARGLNDSLRIQQQVPRIPEPPRSYTPSPMYNPPPAYNPPRTYSPAPTYSPPIGVRR